MAPVDAVALTESAAYAREDLADPIPDLRTPVQANLISVQGLFV
mgnify:CR=1 FL=1|jgi:hypothetical protein